MIELTLGADGIYSDEIVYLDDGITVFKEFPKNVNGTIVNNKAEEKTALIAQGLAEDTDDKIEEAQFETVTEDTEFPTHEIVKAKIRRKRGV